MNFWECLLGEEFANDQCNLCSPGFYALEEKAKVCLICMDNADCLGGSEISVSEGYWWDNVTWSEILQCYESSACLGGYFDNQTHPV